MDSPGDGQPQHCGHHSNNLRGGCCGSSGGAYPSLGMRKLSWVAEELLPERGLEDQRDEVGESRCEVQCALNSMYRGLEECLGKGNNPLCLGYRKLGGWGQKTRFQVQLIAQLIQSWNLENRSVVHVCLQKTQV